MFLALNRGKRSVRVDLKHEPGPGGAAAAGADADILLESFRPGVMDRLGVGYERLRARNPALVYCAISGYGQGGPGRDRSGHDMNYLALNGLLGLTGERDGPPVQSAGQIADLGGGALMAAVGMLVALRERDRSGEGQLVDFSMFDGALSWLAMVAAETLATGRAPRRGELQLAGDSSATGRTRAPMVTSRSARWSRSFGRHGARASVARTWSSTSSMLPDRRRTMRSARCSRHGRASSGARLRPSTTAASSRCSSSTRCSIPSSCARAR